MKIDTHIPAPETANRAGGGRPASYPFGEMPVGGSFAASPGLAEKIASAAQKWKERHPGWDYRTRKTSQEFRVWRIS